MGKRNGGKGEFPVLHTPIWQFIAQMALGKWNRAKAFVWLKERVAKHKDLTLTLTTLRAAAGYWVLKKGLDLPRDSTLSGIMLDSVDLTELDLARFDLSGADFHGSDLAGADLSSADLSRAVLAGAQFLGANLKNAKLDRCDISFADFRGANFGSKNSSTWSNTLSWLRNCEGRSSALFDEEVRSFLK